MNCPNTKVYSMSRATTPTHFFRIAIDPDTCKEILITYKQRGEIVLEKRKDDLSFSVEEGEETKYICSFKLTQEETNQFRQGDRKTEIAQIQMRILTLGGDSLKSNIVEVSVEDVLNDEVLT